MNDKVEKVKQHFKENRRLYIGGTVLVIAAGTAGYFLGGTNITIPIQSAIGYKSVITQTQETVIVPRGHRGYKILVNETGQEFGSIRHMCKELGLMRYDVYQFFKGEIPNVHGFTFTNKGENL